MYLCKQNCEPTDNIIISANNKMKKLFLGVALTLALVACNQETSQHYISVIYPSSGSMFAVYADHTRDSIVLLTYDSYRCSLLGGSEWLTLSEEWKEQNLANTYYSMYRIAIPVDMTPNTTGVSREATVSINNYGVDWNQTIYTGFYQYGWLDVSRPFPEIMTSENEQRRALFELKDSAAQVTDSICFRTERAWTLTSKQNLVAMDKTSGEGGEEKTMVKLTLTPNLPDKERIDTLVLQSNGVTTPIYVKQSAVRKEE